MTSKNPLFTVFTPTYNRVNTLHRVFESLISQTYQDFEWIIVDDGSTDDTRKLIEFYQFSATFKVSYFYQQNAGKHIAINKGLMHASGELFLIADSDDSFVPESLEVLRANYKSIRGNNNYAGIWCLCVDNEGAIIGDSFPEDIWDAYAFERNYKHSLKGEKWHVERTEVLRKFPFPDTRNCDSEVFYFGESAVWNKIYNQYLGRHINLPLRIYHHSADGIMSNIGTSNTRLKTLRYGALYQLNNEIDYFLLNPREFLYRAYVYNKASMMLNMSIKAILSSVDSLMAKVLVILTMPLCIFKK